MFLAILILLIAAITRKIFCRSKDVTIKAIGVFPELYFILLFFSYVAAIPYGIVVLHFLMPDMKGPTMFFVFVFFEIFMSLFMLGYLIHYIFCARTRQDDHLSEIDGLDYAELEEEIKQIEDEFKNSRDKTKKDSLAAKNNLKKKEALKAAHKAESKGQFTESMLAQHDQ